MNDPIAKIAALSQTTKNILGLGLLIVSLGLVVYPQSIRAESIFIVQPGGAPISGSARLDLGVTIPKFVYLRVGTGTNFANNAAVNLISFTVPAAQVGSGTPINATAGSGDLGNGVVTARLIGNNGNVTLSVSALGALNNGIGDVINYNQINTVSAVLTTPTALPAPALSNTSSNVTVTAVAKVVNRDARWTYTYQNASLVAPGTYGGVNVRNGRVTYTASMP